jgi:hypothetical protein
MKTAIGLTEFALKATTLRRASDEEVDELL